MTSAPTFATLLRRGMSKGPKPYLDETAFYVGKVSTGRRNGLYGCFSDIG
ncbi:hypothetical protein PS712_03457 [Pseudomonas fluorescens]|uniref:Uncharacterized protein n=1 Tax=Pseudomonas fluorescens TaxID=294 RepID=A0A5E7DGD5_PSEFL|nr:hypothetical protein PS712_03457 [Pseudomonas fluorescens]